MCELSGRSGIKSCLNYRNTSEAVSIFTFKTQRYSLQRVQMETTNKNLNPPLCACQITLFPSQHLTVLASSDPFGGPDVSFMFGTCGEEPCWSFDTTELPYRFYTHTEVYTTTPSAPARNRHQKQGGVKEIMNSSFGFFCSTFMRSSNYG